MSKSYDNINIFSQTSEFTPSLLQNFSAPVILKADLTNDDYLKILKFDSDGFNRWDAIQNLFLDSYFNKNTLSSIIPVLQDLLSKKSLNASLLSHLFYIPSRNTFENFLDVSDPIEVFNKRKKLMKIIGNALEDVLEIKVLDFYHNDIEDDTKQG